MKTERQKEQNRMWMQRDRERKRGRARSLVPRAMELILMGKCPFCEFLLGEEWHTKSPCFPYQLYLVSQQLTPQKIQEERGKNIHTKIAEGQVKRDDESMGDNRHYLTP